MLHQNNDIELIQEKQTKKDLELPRQGVFEVIHQAVNSLKREVTQLRQEGRSQYFDLKQDTVEIKKAVVPVPKTKQIKKPLRAAATTDVYYHLMNLNRLKNERRLSYSRFRVAITLLWFTGLRINEIRKFTEKEISALINDGTLQVYQPKVNTYREVILPPFGQEALRIIQDDISLVFKNHDTLSGNSTPSSWIRFINLRLVEHTEGLYKNVRSHSFRINYATSLLRKAPLEVVAELIGHRDIKTTLKYNRYNATKQKKIVF